MTTEPTMETYTKPNTNPDDFEYRHHACPTCHQSLDTCPDCGQQLSQPSSGIYCISDNVLADHIGYYMETGHEMMGFPAEARMRIFQCPVCKKTYVPGLGNQCRETYVKDLEMKS